MRIKKARFDNSNRAFLDIQCLILVSTYVRVHPRRGVVVHRHRFPEDRHRHVVVVHRHHAAARRRHHPKGHHHPFVEDHHHEAACHHRPFVGDHPYVVVAGAVVVYVVEVLVAVCVVAVGVVAGGSLRPGLGYRPALFLALWHYEPRVDSPAWMPGHWPYVPVNWYAN